MKISCHDANGNLNYFRDFLFGRLLFGQYNLKFVEKCSIFKGHLETYVGLLNLLIYGDNISLYMYNFHNIRLHIFYPM